MTALTEDDIAYAGVVGQRALLRSGQLTSVELLDLVLRRIARLDSDLGAFRTLFDTARAEALAADIALAAGDERPLLGVPMAVKDNLPVTGQRQLMGTASPQPIATADAEIARRLRAAGAVLVGSTNLPELALWPFTESKTNGPTRNPWDLGHTPGGSSGGSAAAVAAGLVAAAHATDGGGSIRIPAACCGLVGLKPTRGFVSLAPATEHWQGLSAAGCVTRSVADTVVVLNALQDRELVLTEPQGLRIAWSVKAPVPTSVDSQVRAALDGAVAALGRLGHSTVAADPSYQGVQASFVVRYATGVAQDLATLVEPASTELRTRLVAALGRRIPAKMLAKAMRQGDAAAARLRELPGDADVLVTPVLAALPRPIGALTGLRTVALSGRVVPFTPAWNVTGQPALAVPVGLSREGLPLSVQLIGKPGSEQLLLSLADQLMVALDHRDQRPPL